MTDFQAVEPLLLELAQLPFGAMVAQVRGHGDAPHVVHQAGDLREARERLLDVGGTPAAEVAAERIPAFVRGFALAEGARAVGPPDRPALRLRIHVAQGDRPPELLPFCADL